MIGKKAPRYRYEGSNRVADTSATDPVTFVLAAVVLAVIGAAATLVPARRATAIDPARALQAE